MSNYCRECGKPLPIDSDSAACWQHGGPALTANSKIQCPFCKETIFAESKKCRFCGEFFVEQVPVPQVTPRTQQAAVTPPIKPTGDRAPQPKRDGTKSLPDDVVGYWMGRHWIWTILILLLLIASFRRVFVVSDTPVSPNLSSQTPLSTGDNPNEKAPASVVERPSLFPPTPVKTLTPAEARAAYAIAMGLDLRKQGIDATVGAGGKNKDELHISMPMTYETMREILAMPAINSTVPNMGFKKLTLADKFEGQISLARMWKFTWHEDAGVWAQ